MELISFLIDFVLHVDVHLRAFVGAYGTWVYALLFLIIFVETGLVVMPFLPGDSLLFVAGALAGAGMMDYPLLVVLLIVAAVAGNQTNYTIGRFVGAPGVGILGVFARLSGQQGAGEPVGGRFVGRFPGGLV